MLENEKDTKPEGDQQMHVSRKTKYIIDDLEAMARSLSTFDTKVTRALLGISRPGLKNLIDAGRLKCYYQGNRLRIPAWSIMDYQSRQAKRFKKDQEKRRLPDREARMENISRARRVRMDLQSERKRLKESFQEQK